jgi:hypothetical protein
MSNWTFAELAKQFAIAFALASAGTAYAATGRVHITLLRAKPAEGIGSLFFRARRYRLHASGINATPPTDGKIELEGSASNMHSAGDIVAIYRAAAPGSGILSASRTARLENARGVVLELKGTNLGASDLDLTGMAIGPRGWHAVIRTSVPK